MISVPEGINCTTFAVDRRSSITTLGAVELADGEPSWRGFCISIIEKPVCLVSSPPYKVSVDMELLSFAASYGHVGMMYNVKDMDTFDFVYFR